MIRERLCRYCGSAFTQPPFAPRRGWCDEDCHKIQERERLIRWRAENPAKVKAQQRRNNRARYLRDPESIKARVAAHRAANPVDASYYREWRRRNPEAAKAAADRWRAKNPEKVNERTRRRQARHKAAKVENVDYEAVAERDGWVCQLCGEPVDPVIRGRTARSVSFDHVVPIARGGAHEEANVQLAHFGCNARKGHRVA